MLEGPQRGRLYNTLMLQEKMVGTIRIELMTPSMSTKCSPTELRALEKVLSKFDLIEISPRGKD